jgi:hypothetical protein
VRGTAHFHEHTQMHLECYACGALPLTRVKLLFMTCRTICIAEIIGHTFLCCASLSVMTCSCPACTICKVLSSVALSLVNYSPIELPFTVIFLANHDAYSSDHLVALNLVIHSPIGLPFTTLFWQMMMPTHLTHLVPLLHNIHQVLHMPMCTHTDLQATKHEKLFKFLSDFKSEKISVATTHNSTHNSQLIIHNS